MPINVIAEVHVTAGKTDLDACLAFTVENVGTVAAYLTFDASATPLQLPAGTKREFEFLGDRYNGEMNIAFDTATSDQRPRVNVIKRTHTCP